MWQLDIETQGTFPQMHSSCLCYHRKREISYHNRGNAADLQTLMHGYNETDFSTRKVEEFCNNGTVQWG
jgi:hypothetical protein